ncbi:MAG: DUF1579 domain-containing protein [Pyrinomonadaceae bacterium]|nr:DUF1579 domain-containing protein [Pyrinomonadaceae bacterium]
MKPLLVLLFVVIPASTDVVGQRPPNSEELLTEQKKAMNKLNRMNGLWRGTAWTILRSGKKQTITQTERMGAFLDGTVKVVEGKGFDTDGNVVFNAFAVISFDTQKKKYFMRSYAQGQAGDFQITPTDDGYTWEIPAGPVTIRYNAVIKDNTLTETGDRIMPNGKSIRFFEMRLNRIGDTDWPSGGSLGPK